jgi:hypothetical protein
MMSSRSAIVQMDGIGDGDVLEDGKGLVMMTILIADQKV